MTHALFRKRSRVVHHNLNLFLLQNVMLVGMELDVNNDVVLALRLVLVIHTMGSAFMVVPMVTIHHTVEKVSSILYTNSIFGY